ncbi:MAG: TAXI family TRAP transporter solute-binding subunit [Steroidobacteraceae bacterium]
MSRAAEPKIDRSLTLNFVGDWGQANFHRVCSWLSQEFCRRAGSRSRVAIWNIPGGGVGSGGIEAIDEVQDGEADLCIVTPAMLIPAALQGRLIFEKRPAPDVRALVVLPQNDRMILALNPALGISTFEQLRAARPALRIATSPDDGTNFIGYVARQFATAHGIGPETLSAWGGKYFYDTHPMDSIGRMLRGEVDGLLQEAVMSPGWTELVEGRRAVPLAAEKEALARLALLGMPARSLPAGYWSTVQGELEALDFSDFLVLVRSDMPEDVAHLLTWCLVERRDGIERQYRHLPPQRSPLSYPLDPAAMSRTTVPLHPGARRYFEETGLA